MLNVPCAIARWRTPACVLFPLVTINQQYTLDPPEMPRSRRTRDCDFPIHQASVTAILGCAVEVSCSIHRQPGRRSIPIRHASEGVQHFEGLGLRRLGCDDAQYKHNREPQRGCCRSSAGPEKPSPMLSWVPHEYSPFSKRRLSAGGGTISIMKVGTARLSALCQTSLIGQLVSVSYTHLRAHE